MFKVTLKKIIKLFDAKIITIDSVIWIVSFWMVPFRIVSI